MSSSTSAKSADKQAAAPNEADTPVEPNSEDSEGNVEAEASSRKDQSALNGTGQGGMKQHSENSAEPNENSTADIAAPSEGGAGVGGHQRS